MSAGCRFTVKVEYFVPGMLDESDKLKTDEELSAEQAERVRSFVMDELGFLETEPGCWVTIDVVESVVDRSE